MKKIHFSVTREKHLDHMVKVTPFIVCGYFLQCYMITHLQLAGFATNTLFFLGFCLITMITGFVTYDLKHKVHFHEDVLEVHFFGKKEISYSDIQSIEVSDEEQNFATLTIKCKDSKKYTFYFIDEADKIKAWLKEKKYPSLKAAA